MKDFPKKLQKKLARREVQNTLRELPETNDLVDFSSNDYLGFSRNREIFERASQILSEKNIVQNGATGSRLLSGNHPLYSELEEKLAEFHQTESALVFNSGYDANIGFFGAVPQRGDIVFYDEHIHASIRDGIKIGNAKSYKFGHNDLWDLMEKCRTVLGRTQFAETGKLVSTDPPADRNDGAQVQKADTSNAVEVPVPSAVEVYVVTESVFSMDGDSPDLKAFAQFCQQNRYHLIVDEAHALGVFGAKGEGLVQKLGLQDAVFARIVTFGKAMGCHGAAILGSMALKKYLVNFARSLIYTTGLPPHSVASILASYEHLSSTENYRPEPAGHPLTLHPSEKEGTIRTGKDLVSGLSTNIVFFNQLLSTPALDISNASSYRPAPFGTSNVEGFDPASQSGRSQPIFIPSNSAIHCCIIPGNQKVKKIAARIREKGFDLRPILSPTVPEGQERLRICLHSFNTEKEITEVLQLLAIFTKEV